MTGQHIEERRRRMTQRTEEGWRRNAQRMDREWRKQLLDDGTTVGWKRWLQSSA